MGPPLHRMTQLLQAVGGGALVPPFYFGSARPFRSGRGGLPHLTQAAGTTELVGSAIKVHGWMTSAAVQRHGTGVLRIVANYLFVYPVQQPSPVRGAGLPALIQ